MWMKFFLLDIESNRLGLFLGVSLKPAVRWTGSGSFSFAYYKAIATYFICLAVCLWIFAVALQ